MPKNKTEPVALATIPMTLNIPLMSIAHLLVSGLESGPTFGWGEDAFTAPPKMAFRYDSKTVFLHIDCPLNEGGSIELFLRPEDKDSVEGKKRFNLDLDKIKTGLVIFAEKCPNQFAAFMAENGDAITGDCFLQCCLLGEVVYG